MSENNSNGSETAYIYARVPPDLHARVKRVADREGVSITQYVTRVLEESTQSVQVPLVARKVGGETIYILSIPPDTYLKELPNAENNLP